MTQHYTQENDQVMLVTSTIRRLHPGSTAAFPSPPVAIADTAPAAVSHEGASASSQHQWAPTLVPVSEIFEAFLLAFLWQSPIFLMDLSSWTRNCQVEFSAQRHHWRLSSKFLKFFKGRLNARICYQDYHFSCSPNCVAAEFKQGRAPNF